MFGLFDGQTRRLVFMVIMGKALRIVYLEPFSWGYGFLQLSLLILRRWDCGSLD